MRERRIARGAAPEGYKAEVFDGRVIMTPQSPERDWTVTDVKDAVKAAEVPRERDEVPYGQVVTLTLPTGERVKIDTSTFPVRDVGGRVREG
ncbi:hypothetical protein ACIG3E_15200 [Streptomyces sp. NPDC053474]|uniref:hypothetical protein n=1 Tax=Streptomyces sp. NPDC053474 TaxID=3365704 RepID=UPI0037D1CF26